jgi:excisionase family DNA binding protein
MITNLQNTMITRAGEDTQARPEQLAQHAADDGPHVSPSYLARFWGVSLNTIYRDIRKGALPAFRVRGQFRIRLSVARRYGRPVE